MSFFAMFNQKWTCIKGLLYDPIIISIQGNMELIKVETAKKIIILIKLVKTLPVNIDKIMVLLWIKWIKYLIKKYF